jgi:hypothetical protein
MRASGELVHVEADPGNVIVVPAWMLDPVACSVMRLGEPQVELSNFGCLPGRALPLSHIPGLWTPGR